MRGLCMYACLWGLRNRTVPHPTLEGTGAEANRCKISDEAKYSPPVPEGP
jgi:hypothetical protein